jgi:outer membrane protein assembly factor BamE (lipoprotein component of BamABCDE complex)
MLKKFALCFLVFVFGSFVISGCVSSIGKRTDRSDLSKIKKWQSTKEDVVEILGLPNQRLDNKDGTTTFFYYESGTKVTQATTIKMDPKGIVTSISRQNDKSTGN